MINLKSVIYSVDRNKRKEGLVESRFNILYCVATRLQSDFLVYQYTKENYEISIQSSNRFMNILESKSLRDTIRELGVYIEDTKDGLIIVSLNYEFELDSKSGYSFNYRDLREDVKSLLTLELKNINIKIEELKEVKATIEKNLIHINNGS